MGDHDNGATVRLAATIARSRHEADGGTMLDGIHPETIVEMALAAKREVDRLRSELAEARLERDARPNISREDARDFSDDPITNADAEARVTSALRAHAAGVDAPQLVRVTSGPAPTVTIAKLREAMPSEGELRTLRDALPLRGMSDYGRITALRIVDRLDAARAKGGV